MFGVNCGKILVMSMPSPETSGEHAMRLDRGKGDLHIPGAGTLGMYVLIASLSMLFAATMMLYIVLRRTSQRCNGGRTAWGICPTLCGSAPSCWFHAALPSTGRW